MWQWIKNFYTEVDWALQVPNFLIPIGWVASFIILFAISSMFFSALYCFTFYSSACGF